MKPDIRIKRIYETAAAADGLRLLVDRLWPRGISKARARLDGWPKELAPSTALRTWFHHAPGAGPSLSAATGQSCACRRRRWPSCAPRPPASASPCSTAPGMRS